MTHPGQQKGWMDEWASPALGQALIVPPPPSCLFPHPLPVRSLLPRSQLSTSAMGRRIARPHHKRTTRGWSLGERTRPVVIHARLGLLPPAAAWSSSKKPRGQRLVGFFSFLSRCLLFACAFLWVVSSTSGMSAAVMVGKRPLPVFPPPPSSQFLLHVCHRPQ
ncbi:hypothetical protein LZ30DRAFT_399606 [Colletotrichum cereale]|nr:hypothetical protein LZ30DRAFT_399606 [Colletotrichum cereale]